MAALYDFSIKTIQGQETTLSQYKNQPLLLVNVASKCGFTPQYKGLEETYQKYKEQGLQVLGFPCNQFGSQEPGTPEEIVQFCQMNFGVTFALFEKVDVNGPAAHPLYQWLTGPESPQPGEIKWNFEKFLINRQGGIAGRYSSRIKPEGGDMQKAIEALL